MGAAVLLALIVLGTAAFATDTPLTLVGRVSSGCSTPRRDGTTR
jgi:hypothetical protein